MSESKYKSPQGIFVRARRNFTILLGGNSVASLIGFATLAVNARALGPEFLGILALLQAFVVVVSSVFSFDTWQPVIKFGAEAQTEKDGDRLRDIFVLGFFYDLIGAFAATSIGLILVFYGLPLVGVESRYQDFVFIFCLAIPFSAYSAAKGMLRLFGRFELLTAVQVGISAASLLAAGILWFCQAAFIAYVFVYAGLIALQSCAVIIVTFAIWRANDLPSLLVLRFGDENLRKAFMRFSWSTSGLSTLGVLRQHADAFVLAALLGPAATGVYKVATQIASLVARLGDPMQQVIFPEIANLAAKGENVRLRRILGGAFLGGLGLFVFLVVGTVLFGDMAIKIVGGGDYAAAAAPLLWLVCSQGVLVAGFYIRPTVVTVVGPEAYLKYSFIATLVFVPALYFGVTLLGLAGAGISQAVFSVVWFFLNGFAIFSNLKMTPGDLRDSFLYLTRRSRK